MVPGIGVLASYGCDDFPRVRVRDRRMDLRVKARAFHLDLLVRWGREGEVRRGHGPIVPGGPWSSPR